MELSRRRLFGFAAAAAVTAAVPLPPDLFVAPVATATVAGNRLLTQQMITAEAVRLFKTTNAFLANIT